ncbi:MAG: hypothetical protein M3Y59_00435 [Myxococcota bacterium]|nr:hypothetical protein [Myxococcota bacterium]
MHATEPVGRGVGALLAPLAGVVSLLRRARTFHPDGAVYLSHVSALASRGADSEIARRLEGPALVRLSSAWWRGGKEWTDVLGCAVRFRHSDAVSVTPEQGDQDLLFATIRSPWTTLLASLTTHRHDFLDNDYYAVSPFFAPGLGKVKWRLRTTGAAETGGDRGEKLDAAVRGGHAAFQLEVRALGLGRRWRPVARLQLRERVVVDQAALRFSPFRSGRGIEPRGWIHAIRRATYAASQAARPPAGAVG